jgi:MFS transporter, DHA2 family, multidrug resistance protein
MAFAFLFSAAGAVIAGWLADKLRRRKLLLILSGSFVIPFTLMMGQAQHIWQLAAATAAVWFLNGIQMSIINILAGLLAAEKERGRVLGLIGMTGGLGSIVGGLSVGVIVDQWGYPTMFMVLCLFSVTLPLVAILIKDKKMERIPSHAAREYAEKPRFGKPFFFCSWLN